MKYKQMGFIFTSFALLIFVGSIIIFLKGFVDYVNIHHLLSFYAGTVIVLITIAAICFIADYHFNDADLSIKLSDSTLIQVQAMQNKDTLETLINLFYYILRCNQINLVIPKEHSSSVYKKYDSLEKAQRDLEHLFAQVYSNYLRKNNYISNISFKKLVLQNIYKECYIKYVQLLKIVSRIDELYKENKRLVNELNKLIHNHLGWLYCSYACRYYLLLKEDFFEGIEPDEEEANLLDDSIMQAEIKELDKYKPSNYNFIERL